MTFQVNALGKSLRKSRVFAMHGNFGPIELTAKTTPVGFEPTRGDPIGLAGRSLNRSAKVSLIPAEEIKHVHYLALHGIVSLTVW